MGTSLQASRNIALILIAASLPTLAQTGNGVVTGTVQDASKAFLPNAQVVLTDKAKGNVRTAATNGAGIYYFGSVIVGGYTLSVEAPGFDKWVGDLEVQAGQRVTVDPVLQIGNVQTKVEVTGAASPIATEGAQISDYKDAKRIHDLPLNGRQVSGLFTLTPGIEGGQIGNGGSSQDGSNPRTNGMMVGSTEMLLDGVSYVDRFGGGIARVQPGLDTVQEYKVETAGSGAQYDRPATIELVTRSGTNQIHGAVFETMRNNYGGLTARLRSDGNDPAKLIRNEFGGWAGGPIVKNKTFWFYDQELLRQRQEVFAQASVPTASMWGGDFSNAIDTSGNKIVLYNPYSTHPDGTRDPFPGNVIPTSLINQQVTNVFKSISPLPNQPGDLNPWTDTNFRTFYPKNTNNNTITARLDQIFSEKDNLSVRYTQAKSNYAQLGGHYGYPPPGVANGTGTGSQDASVYSIVARWDHTFTPSFLNEVQLSAHRSLDSSGTLGDNTNWDAKLGLPNPFGTNGWPTIYTDNGQFLYGGGWDGDNHKSQALTEFQIDDNVTWVKSKHTLKFGFKGRQEFNNVEELQQSQGSDSFYGDWTSQYDTNAQAATPFTGSGFGSLELGLPTYLSNQYNRGYFYFQQKEIGLYANDTWKVTPRLTIDVGLRWDYWTPYHEKYNRLVNIDLNSLSSGAMQVVFPQNATLATVPGIPPGVISSWAARGLTTVSADSIHFPGALTPNVYTDFGPRFGVAYRISDKWVLRGGYGAYYWPMPLSQLLQTSRTNAPLNLRFQNSIADQNGTNYNYALTHAPAATDKVGGATVDINTPQGISAASQSFLAMDVNHWNDDKVQEWTFTIEREIMANTVLKLSYIGTHGSNLQQLVDTNAATSKYNYQAQTGLQAPTNGDLRRVNPNWNLTGSNGVLEHIGYSNSSSFQVDLERRFSNGLAFQFFYTYDHAMGTNDTGGYASGSASLNGNFTNGSLAIGSVPANNEIIGTPNLTLAQRLRFVYTNSSQVPPQRITWNGVYELPFGKGKKFAGGSNRAVDALIGGWQIGFIGTWENGFWQGVNSGNYIFTNPALSSGKRLTMNIFGKNQQLWFAGYFNPAGATNVNLSQLEAIVPVDPGQRAIHPLGSNYDNRVPQTLANGTSVNTSITDNLSWNPRNFFLGPPSFSEDASLFKYFNFGERFRLRLSGDFFNVFNHPVDVNPNATTGLVDLSTQVNAPRIIQVGARFEW